MRAISWPVVAAAFAVSLWLRLAFPIYAMGFSAYDDFLFLRLADFLARGEWLGPYGNLTHAKGAAYSALIALTYSLGLPLKPVEHVIYLLCSLYFAIVAGTSLRSRAIATAIFVLLAFNPVFWAPEIGGRVVRENLYMSLTLLVLALGIRVYVFEPMPALRAELRAKGAALVALGVTGGLFWLTREEGAWLAPSVAVLAAYGIAQQARAQQARAKSATTRAAIVLGIPIVLFGLVVGAVDAMNLHKYGVFRNNDFRSADFQSAYGALARIKHDRWMNYDVFPRDARARAYSVSSAARELQPYFEGEGGEFWRKVSCDQTQGAYCAQIHSGWFMWALREAVTAAGHYRSAPDAQAYYRRLAEEINTECGRRAIECGPPNHSLIPPWRPEFVGLTLDSLGRIGLTMAKLGDPKVYISPSTGLPEQLAFYERMTHSKVGTAADASNTGIRFHIAQWLAHGMIAISLVALPAALVAWLLLLVVTRARPFADHVIVAALVAAVGMRVALLSFLDATSIPSNSSLYPSPAVPLALGMVPCIARLAVRWTRTRKESDRR